MNQQKWKIRVSKYLIVALLSTGLISTLSTIARADNEARNACLMVGFTQCGEWYQAFTPEYDMCRDNVSHFCTTSYPD